MKLNELLGTEFPLIQGGMANIATGEFAAAVSNAGALGLIGAGGMNADMLREHIRRCKDCAAGAVLIVAVFAVIIGFTLFWDTERFAAVGAYFCEAPVRFVLLGIAVVAAAVFVFLPERFKKHG